MNLEDLKNNWQEENIENIPEVSLSKQKELRQPLSIIRKNMKMELWTSVLFILAMFVIVFFWIENTRLLLYAEMLLGMMMLISGYYFWKFKNLYQAIEKPNYSTFQSLLDLNYSLKYYTDLYVSYYVSFVPFLFCEILLMYEFDERLSKFQSENIFVLFVVSLLVAFVIFYFLGKMFFNAYYGKYIAEVANLLKRINHPYEDFENQIVKVDHKQYWYSRTGIFFQNYLGNILGGILNLVFWLSLFILLAFLAGFLVGYVGMNIK